MSLYICIINFKQQEYVKNLSNIRKENNGG